MSLHVQPIRALGLEAAVYAASLTASDGLGFSEHAPVTPASVMKIQVALAVEVAIAEGRIAGDQRVTLRASNRTPGPVGISLMQDDVVMSVRDLVTAMLTISDNAATDELIAAAGLEQINGLLAALGLEQTVIESDLHGCLNRVAQDAGFVDYQALVRHEPATDGPPSATEVAERIARATALDPTRGTRTTPFETVSLLQAIWTDRLPAEACVRVRAAMGRQLTRTRIASGFDSSVSVAAKSGALLGVVRNEAGVVTYPDGRAYAVAVFTRKDPGNATDPAAIDAAIGRVARALVEQIRAGEPA